MLGALAGAAILTGMWAPRERYPIVAAAFGVLVLAFVSPLCALASALFSARAVHHILLVACAAPLIALIGPAERRPIGIAVPFAVSTVTLWAWHLPAAYTAALNQHAIYWVMQLTLLGTAVWFWYAILAARATLPAALVTVAAAAGQMGLLGALLTFAPDALYPHHMIAPIAFGMGPLRDQQLAGLIMWVPGMVPYAVIAGLLARRAWTADWLRSAA